MAPSGMLRTALATDSSAFDGVPLPGPGLPEISRGVSTRRWCTLCLVLWCCAGCWGSVDAQASAGGILSRPIVHAELVTERIVVPALGMDTYRWLKVEVDDEPFKVRLESPGTEVAISPDRKMFAVGDGTQPWMLYTLGTSNGTLALTEEGRGERLYWPPAHRQPVPDYGWLLWLVPPSALAGVAGAVLWRIRRRRAATSSPSVG